MSDNKMDPKWKQIWMNELRSGKRKQGRQWLLNKNGYCCLGVLCDLIAPDKWVPAWAGRSTDGLDLMQHDYGGLGLPTKDIREQAGLSVEQCSTLAKLNDGGKTFEQIADYIEQNL